jgi:hypothetical protein
LSLSGCGRAPRQAERTLLPADYRTARQAMSLKGSLLMLRNGYKDPAIIAEVIRRHVTEKPDAQTKSESLETQISFPKSPNQPSPEERIYRRAIS